MISFTKILSDSQKSFTSNLMARLSPEIGKSVIEFVNFLREGTVYNKVNIFSANFSSLIADLHLEGTTNRDSDKTYWMHKIADLIIRELTDKLNNAGVCEFTVRASGDIADNTMVFWVTDK